MTSWSARICSYLIFTCCWAVFLLTDVGETGAYVDEFVQMRKLEEISGSDGEKMMLCGSICRRHSLNEVNAQAPDSCSSCVYWVSCSCWLQPCVCVSQYEWIIPSVCLWFSLRGLFSLVSPSDASPEVTFIHLTCELSSITAVVLLCSLFQLL